MTRTKQMAAVEIGVANLKAMAKNEQMLLDRIKGQMRQGKKKSKKFKDTFSGSKDERDYEKYIESLKEQAKSYEELFVDYKNNPAYFIPQKKFDEQVYTNLKQIQKDLDKNLSKVAEARKKDEEELEKKRKNALKNFFIYFFTILASIFIAVVSMGTATGVSAAIISLSQTAIIALSATAAVITVGLAVFSLGESCGWNFRKVTWDNVINAVISIVKTIVSAIPGVGVLANMAISGTTALLQSAVTIGKQIQDGKFEWSSAATSLLNVATAFIPGGASEAAQKTSKIANDVTKGLTAAISTGKAIEIGATTGNWSGLIGAGMAVASAALPQRGKKLRKKIAGSSKAGAGFIDAIDKIQNAYNQFNKYTGNVFKACAVNVNAIGTKNDVVTCNLNEMAGNIGNAIDKKGYSKFRSGFDKTGLDVNLGTVGFGSGGAHYAGWQVGANLDKLTKNKNKNIRLGHVSYGDSGFSNHGQDINIPNVKIPHGVNLNIPNVSIPNLNTPNINIPNVSIPKIDVGNINIPANLDIPNLNIPKTIPADVNIPKIKNPTNVEIKKQYMDVLPVFLRDSAALPTRAKIHRNPF